jgi:hypothetical protein
MMMLYCGGLACQHFREQKEKKKWVTYNEAAKRMPQHIKPSDTTESG